VRSHSTVWKPRKTALSAKSTRNKFLRFLRLTIKPFSDFQKADGGTVERVICRQSYCCTRFLLRELGQAMQP